MKINPKYIAIIIVIILLCFLSWCHGKNGTTKHTTGTDTLTTQNKEAVKVIVKIDSSLIQVVARSKQDSINRMNNYNNLLKRYYKAIKQAPDTCRSYIDTIYGDALIIDLTDSIAILRKDTVIKLLTAKVDKYKLVTHNDTIRMGQLSDSLKTVYKSRFWKGYGKGFRHGTLFGVSVDESARAGIRMIKP